MSQVSNFAVTGTVDAVNFSQWHARGVQWLDQQPPAMAVVMDLAALEHANSIAVALLLGWFRHADSLGKALQFAQVPPALADIIELSGLTEVLPLQ